MTNCFKTTKPKRRKTMTNPDPHAALREHLAELFDVARRHHLQKPLPGWAR